MRHARLDARVEAWAEAYRQGIAGAACDRIVRSRPVPAALLVSLGRVEHGLDPTGRVQRWQDAPLTPREREVLRCFGCGLRSRDVAALLGISRNTVMSHKRRIQAKLRARNFAHAYAIAHRAGLLA